MNTYETFKTSFSRLRVNKKRSLLTMLGIIIGIASVIIIMAVGAGAQSLILNQIQSAGTNLFAIFPGKADEEGPPASLMGITITTLKYEDIAALRKKGNVPHLEAIAPNVRGVSTVTWGSRHVDTTFIGTSVDYPGVENVILEQGRFFNTLEEKNIGRVVVLGSQVKTNLFRDEDPIGKKVKIKKHTFQVIGYLEPKGVSGFTNQDDMVLIPITSAQKLILGINHISFARGKVDNEENIEQTVADVKAVLTARHGDEDFTVRSQMQALDIFGSVTDGIRFFLAAIAAISLLVGGIGIMNIMLITVSERTNEVGLRKAIGAKRKDILYQFLIESVVLTLTGGVIGIVIGVSFSALVSVGVKYMGYDWDFIVSLSSIFVACFVSILVGLVFGMYPAKRAAGMNPTAALRYE